MNIIVIGLGSMGKRRIRLLKEYDRNIKLVGVDNNTERRKRVEEQYCVKTFVDIESACKKEEIDCAFVATSPLSHAAIIRECLKRNMHVFSEINLVDTLYRENMELAEKKNRVLFLSSTFLYRKEIEFIKDEMQSCSSKVNYLYHTGQYLPDWHPWESYKDFFVGQKETSGCRELMAIEFPWLIDTFGDIEDFLVVSGKMSSLELDYPDSYLITFEHKGGNKGVVVLDVVSRKPVRNLEVFDENIYLSWDGTPNGLKKYNYTSKKDLEIDVYKNIDKNMDYSATIIENAYYEEIKNFFGIISGEEYARYSFLKDKEVLKMIEKIETKSKVFEEQERN